MSRILAKPVVHPSVSRRKTNTSTKFSQSNQGEKGKNNCSEIYKLLTLSRQLNTPEHEIVTIDAKQTDEEASQRIRDVMKALLEGSYGKKVLLKLESNHS